MSETKENDILDEIKKIDKAVKAKILVENISHLKKIARQINELRAETNLCLKELGISNSDSKRIIDYVNELPGVKLSEKDTEKIRERVIENIESKRETIVEEIENIDINKFMDFYTNNSISWNGTTAIGTHTTSGIEYLSIAEPLVSSMGRMSDKDKVMAYQFNVADGANSFSVKL